MVLVSKPLVPPWNDGSKNLARDVAEGLERYRPLAFAPRGVEIAGGRGVRLTLPGQVGFAPGLLASAALLGRLAFAPPAALWHFFFAPNPKTSHAGALLSRLRRVPTVHTVPSRPARLDASLCFADRTVVLGRATEEALLHAGVPRAALVRVPPAAPDPGPISERRRVAARPELPDDAALLLFPGDLEHGEGAAICLDALAHLPADAHLVLACRRKTSRFDQRRLALEARARALGVRERVHLVGEVEDIHALIAAADVVLLPSRDLFAKTDIPLVLLEAAWLARPILVASESSAAELADAGAARAVAPRPRALAETINELLEDEAARLRLGAGARVCAAASHAPAAMAAAYEAIYDDVLAARGARAEAP